MVVEIAIFLGIAGFAVISGFNDGGNLIATFLASGTLTGRVVVPLLLCGIGLGPIIFGTAVSHTIALEIVNFRAAGHEVLLVALLAALGTLLLTWRLRIPTSTTIALGGGMIGAAFLSGKGQLVHWSGVAKLGIGLVGSVVIGFLVAWILTTLLWALLAKIPVTDIKRLSLGQYVTVFWQGLAYGANDQEKAIGLMTIFFMILAHSTKYHVTWLAIVLPLIFWAVGLVVGGWRIARTVGSHIFRLRPMNALSTQAAAAITVSMAALLGLPVSTTQTTDGCLFGMGASLDPLHVRWPMVRKIIVVWLLTMPIAMIIGGTGMAMVAAFR
ncbi:MAG: inorganic phosphate transporter [Firmicutes bacterium]|jgi:PiT family inorganic phosphate transporter|nr:inorganic phosphate transporter [Bacillota bacterium]